MTQMHPYPPFVPPNPTALILGSTPPCRFCNCPTCHIGAGDVDFYYGSEDNSFWDLLSHALSENRPLTKIQMESLLTQHQIAMADILLEFDRINHSASDMNITCIKFNHLILPILKKVNRVYCTSNQVFHWLKAYLQPLGYLFQPHHCDKRKYNVTLEATIKLECIILFSPSRQALRGLGGNQEYQRLMTLDPNYSTAMFRQDDYTRQFQQ